MIYSEILDSLNQINHNNLHFRGSNINPLLHTFYYQTLRPKLGRGIVNKKWHQNESKLTRIHLIQGCVTWKS